MTHPVIAAIASELQIRSFKIWHHSRVMSAENILKNLAVRRSEHFLSKYALVHFQYSGCHIKVSHDMLR